MGDAIEHAGRGDRQRQQRGRGRPLRGQGPTPNDGPAHAPASRKACAPQHGDRLVDPAGGPGSRTCPTACQVCLRKKERRDFGLPWWTAVTALRLPDRKPRSVMRCPSSASSPEARSSRNPPTDSKAAAAHREVPGVEIDHLPVPGPLVQIMPDPLHPRGASGSAYFDPVASRPGRSARRRRPAGSATHLAVGVHEAQDVALGSGGAAVAHPADRRIRRRGWPSTRSA